MQSKTAIRSRGVVMLAALLGVLLVKPVLGQEPAEPDDSTVEPETNAPAESISEDLSVSFPVDI